jgi:hypothetical protein
MPGSSVRALAATCLGRKRLVAVSLLFLAFAGPPAPAADKPDCEVAGLALWGDGKHDDTRALNAWFRGDRVVWAQTGRFERFQMIWPARKERISGGTILTGDDPDKPAVQVGIVKIGAGPEEGVPYAAPAPKPGTRELPQSCLLF